MLWNWARNRLHGPRFLPSGKRLGPYWCSRVEAAPASRPVPRLVPNRLSTSSTAKACQAVAPAPALEFTVASIWLLLPVLIHLWNESVLPREERSARKRQA